MPIRFLSHAHQPPPPIPNPKPHHLPTLAPFHSAIFRMQGRRPSSAPSPFGVAPHPPSRFLSKSIRTIFPKTAFPLSELRKIALHPLFIGVRRFSGSNNWGMSRFPQRLYIRQSLSQLFRHVICRLVCRHTHRLGVVLYDIINK